MLLRICKFKELSKPRVIIRTANVEDEKELALLAYKTYYNRFFNLSITNEKGGSLRCYPELIPDDERDLGQNLKSFQAYWKGAVKELNAGFLCIVAEQVDSSDRKILGFVKGYLSENKEDSIKLKFGVNKKVGELGSLYIDSSCQFSRIGSILVQEYAKKLDSCGFNAMITKCYIRNNSQSFFKKMGAEFVSSCEIPNIYRNGSGGEGVCFIGGDIMGWNSDQMAKLLNIDVFNVDKGKDIDGAILQYNKKYRE